MENRKYHLKTLLIVIISIWAFSSYAQDPNFHIYLAFGQSNMAGNGTSADLSTQDLTTDSRFQILRSADCFSTYGQWETAVPPLCRCTSVAIGPTDYFGKTMVANLPSQVKVGVVVVAVGGSKIELFDKNNYASYVASAPNWMKNEINQYGGNPYGRLVELAKEAQKVGVIKGILFHQGESNTGESTWPTKVKGVYDNLLNDLGLAASETPLLVGELVHSTQGGACGSHNSVIVTMPNVISNSHVISSLGLPCKSDNLHFTAASYRTLGERYANKMLELLPTIDPNFPEVTITSPTPSTEFTAPATIEITATASDPNGTVAKVEFLNGTTKLGEDATAPYSYIWSNVAAGTYTINAIATDNEGNTTTTSVTIEVNIPQTAFGGTPHPIPGKIEFEDFDVCGNGCAYYDDSPGTDVPTPPNYRSDEDVDIETCTDASTGSATGGYNLGYTKSGEWLEYTVDVVATGTYDLAIRASTDGDKTISLSYADGISIASDIAIPSTGGWQTWQTITVEDIELTAGEQVIRVTIGATNYVNLNNMTFTAQSSVTPPTVAITSPVANATYTVNSIIVIAATASATNASIKDVKFYAGAKLLATDNSAPYSFDWSEMSAGNYVIKAVVTDSEGSEASDVVSISVIKPTLTLDLKAGWNMVGCPLSGTSAIETALSSIWDKVEIVKDFDGFYDKSSTLPLNSLSELVFGKGYFIKVENDCELSWGN